MKTYIFTIEMQNKNNDVEYKTIVGVYAEVETAKQEATEKLNMQKGVWKGSWICKLGKGKVALINKDGYKKVYQIAEYEIK